MGVFFMAHVAKYTRGAIQGLSNHLDRKTENHSNKDIDVSKSYLNYDLNQNQGDTISRLNERLEQVYCMNRKDVKAVADWIVTLPKELEDRPADEQRQFFQATKDFLDKQYGEENNISANVHMDETTPHWTNVKYLDTKIKKKNGNGCFSFLSRVHKMVIFWTLFFCYKNSQKSFTFLVH